MPDSNAMIDFSRFPKTHKLDDGREVQVRQLLPEDRDRLFSFFKHLPSKDRRYLRHDVTQREVITNWCSSLDYDRVLPLVALWTDEDGRSRIVADGTLHTDRHGWSTHVGEIRLTIHQMFRNQGLGKIMLRELYDRAVMRGVEKIQAFARDDNENAARLLKRLGFRKEAAFRDHAVDSGGRKHDVTVFSSDLNRLWSNMEDLNIDYDFFQMP